MRGRRAEGRGTNSLKVYMTSGIVIKKRKVKTLAVPNKMLTYSEVWSTQKMLGTRL